MASPLNRRTAREREELDIDALFASETDQAPEPDRPAPTLIFTQPADRNVQQFADEAVPFADEPVRFGDEPVHFAEEADPLAVPLLPSPEHPYKGRWNQPELPKRGRARMAAVLLVLAGVIALIVTSLLSREPADLGTGVSTAESKPVAPPASVSGETATANPGVAARTPETPVMTPPAAADVPPQAGAAAPMAARRPESQVAVTRPEPPAATVRGRPGITPRETTGPAARTPVPAATSGRVASAEPPVSTRGITSAPPTAPPAAAPPVAEIRRPAGDASPALGQPLGPPRELPAAPASPDASPAPRVEPSPAAAAPSAPAAAPALDPRAVEADRVRAVLSGYERAYSELDAEAASRVFPAIDRKALSRAFSSLSAQQIQFDDCRIQVLQASARATCAGTARWTPKVGSGTQQQARRWQFDLEQGSGGWRIGSVRVQ